MSARTSPDPTPKGLAETLQSIYLLTDALRLLLYHTNGAGADGKLVVAAGGVVLQVERLVVEAQEDFERMRDLGYALPVKAGRSCAPSPSSSTLGASAASGGPWRRSGAAWRPTRRCMGELRP